MGSFKLIPRHSLPALNSENSCYKIRLLYRNFQMNHCKKYIKNNKIRWLYEAPIFSNFCVNNNAIFLFSRRYCKAKENSLQDANRSGINSTFQDMLSFRKNQAQCSILFELLKRDDIPYVSAICEQFGKVEKAYCYEKNSGKIILLTEFANKASAEKLLHSCQWRNISDTFPAISRMVQFEKKYDRKVPTTSVSILEDIDQKSSKKLGTVSQIIEDMFLNEKLSELDIRLRHFFCAVIKESLSGLFPYCDVIPFGSSVNGVGKHGCDLDVMIRLYPEKVDSSGELFFLNKTCIGETRDLQKRTVWCLGEYFRTFLPGLSLTQVVRHARMPICKVKHSILNIESDISINNMSAVLMSEIFYYCGEIDSRVRPLIYGVKKWAKEANVTYSSPGSWITNFGLSLLVLFFLQNRPLPILPPLNDAICIVGEDNSTNYRIEYLKSSSEWQEKASRNTESLAILLKEFLSFLSNFPFQEMHISLLTGMSVLRDKGNKRHQGDSLWVQYPVEEYKNVTKNVSEREFLEMCEKAHLSSKHLASNMTQFTKDFSFLLGIPAMKRLSHQKSGRIDVRSLLGR